MGAVFRTADEMILEAHKRGFTRDVSTRLIYDWAKLGLLDYPAQPGRGRGHKSRWSEEQLQLFLVLLDKRQGAKRITALYNIPTWLWLYWGDRYASLSQVKRALRTWGKSVLRTWGRASTGSWVDARKAARHLLSQLIFPLKRIPRQRQLLAELTNVIYERRISRTSLLPLVQRILAASGKGQIHGPAAYLFNAENTALQIASGSEAVNHLDEISDGAFEWARRLINLSNRAYAREQPLLAKDPDLGYLFGEHGPAESLNKACEDLAQTLGMTRLGLPSTIKDSLRDPNVWDALQLTSEGGVVRTRSGLIIASRG